MPCPSTSVGTVATLKTEENISVIGTSTKQRRFFSITVKSVGIGGVSLTSTSYRLWTMLYDRMRDFVKNRFYGRTIEDVFSDLTTKELVSILDGYLASRQRHGEGREDVAEDVLSV